MKKFGLAMFGLLAVTACSIDTINDSDADERTFYQTYGVYYNEADSSIMYTAKFRVGGNTGTTVRLTPPASVKVGSKNLEVETILGTWHVLREQKETKSLKADYTFTWTQRDGTQIRNTVPMAEPVSRI